MNLVYTKKIGEEQILFLRQVNDFRFNDQDYRKKFNTAQQHLTKYPKRLGIISIFNGTNIS